MKQPQPINEESYPYKKDNTITITKLTFSGKDKDSKVIHKYNAEKDGRKIKGFPSEEDAVSLLKKTLSKNEESNVINLKLNTNINSKNQENMTKLSLEELNKQLEVAKKGLSKDQIKNNPTLKTSLESKIKQIESVIAEREKSKESKVVEKETPKKDAPKKDAPKKDTPKKDVPKKDVSNKPSSGGGFKVGDNVEFESRDTGKNIKGTIVKLELVHGKNDEFNAYVQVGKEKKKVRAHKLTKI